MIKSNRKKSLFRRKVQLLTLIGVLLSLIVLTGVFMMFIIDIEDVIYTDGVITPERSFNILSHVDGRITKINFYISQEVKKGDVILELDASEYEIDISNIQTAIQTLKSELEVAKAEYEVLKCNPLPKELWYAQTNYEESKDKSIRTEKRVERVKRIKNVLSQTDIENAEIENIKVQAELKRNQEILRMVKSGIADKTLQKLEKNIELIKTKIKGKEVELSIIHKKIEDRKIVAPVNGKLLEMPCKDVNYVEKGIMLAKMSVGGIVRGIAYVDEATIRKVAIGQDVRISSGVFNRLQYGSFLGKVNRIYDTPVKNVNQKSNMPQYPVEVIIDSKGQPLKFGSSAEFSIITGREPVFYAIFGLNEDEEFAIFKE